MGCFSFLCKKCGEPILSNSFSGQPVELFLLNEGRVVEHLSGEYDSYGRVFDKTPEKESILWDMSWSNVCNLMFDYGNSSGIAAIHTKCYEAEIPTTQSKDDPNQGWGEDIELMGNIDPEQEY